MLDRCVLPQHQILTIKWVAKYETLPVLFNGEVTRETINTIVG